MSFQFKCINFHTNDYKFMNVKNELDESQNKLDVYECVGTTKRIIKNLKKNCMQFCNSLISADQF